MTSRIDIDRPAFRSGVAGAIRGDHFRLMRAARICGHADPFGDRGSTAPIGAGLRGGSDLASVDLEAKRRVPVAGWIGAGRGEAVAFLLDPAFGGAGEFAAELDRGFRFVFLLVDDEGFRRAD